MIDLNGNKCVIVMDAALPLGLIANTAAVLAANVGRDHPEIFGPDVPDASAAVHSGITAMPFPVLRSTAGGVKELRAKAAAVEELEVCAFNSVAQASVRYDQYAERLAATDPEHIEYLGLALFGPAKRINSLTGSLGLLR